MIESDLTDNELEAKNMFLRMVDSYNDPIDTGKISDIKAEIPKWFDEKKYERGRKYYKDNKVGINLSNMNGLILLLCDPNGLDLLVSTGKSSTVETARKRYVDTILHVDTWYDYELKRDSNSWRSLLKVRRLHLSASNAAMAKNDGFISQIEVASTLFGFMGIATIRPHQIGIKYDNREDREGFIHLWAVLAYILGLKDEVNFCLCKLEVVEIVLEILLRYVFFPIVQFETVKFKEMVTILLNGLKTFIPDLTYESQIFLARRVCGVPGYQYNVDKIKENLIRDIFTAEEFAKVLDKVTRNKYSSISKRFLTNDIKLFWIKCNETFRKISDIESENDQVIAKILGISNLDLVASKIIPHHQYREHLNDAKFKELSFQDQTIVRLRCAVTSNNNNSIGHYFNSLAYSFILNSIQRWHKRKSKSPLY